MLRLDCGDCNGYCNLQTLDEDPGLLAQEEERQQAFSHEEGEEGLRLGRRGDRNAGSAAMRMCTRSKASSTEKPGGGIDVHRNIVATAVGAAIVGVSGSGDRYVTSCVEALYSG